MDWQRYTWPSDEYCWRPHPRTIDRIIAYGKWRHQEGLRLEDPFAGDLLENIVGVAGEIGVPYIMGHQQIAKELLLRGNWRLHDGGYDFEVGGLKYDAKAVSHLFNPTLMLRHDRNGKCDRNVLALVNMKRGVPVAVALVGWIEHDKLLENYEVREEFCGKPLKVPARCAPHHELEPAGLLLRC